MPAPDSREAYVPSRLALLLAAAAGVLVFERCLGFRVLDTRALDWIFHWGIDPSVNFMGWHMFRSEPWSLPPGILHSYGHPVGSSIGITDSLPVVAMPLKVIDAWLPPTFQFLGLWYLACFVLLAVFGGLLVATATASPWLQALGGSLIALSPTLIHRMGHASLSGHWLIVAALWLHVRCRDNGMSRGRLALWLALLWVAAGVTPYIAAMVVALAVPSLIAKLRDGVIPALATGLAFAAVTGVGWWASGYFVLDDDDLRNSGFGILSTNLLAPFDAPAGSLLARILSIDLASADQLEGYCYFGLGVFWLIAVALAAARHRRRGTREEPASRPGRRIVGLQGATDIAFAIVLLGLGLFAVSSTVTFGTRVLFEYDPSWWGPVTLLRASGRFIWPLYYALVFALVGVVARRLTRRAAIAVLAAAVMLQAADLWGPLATVRAAHATELVDPLPSRFWDRVPPRYEHLVLNPTNMCSPAGFDYRYFALAAGRAHMTINAGYAARHDPAAVAAYCRTLADDTANRRVREDTLYVVADALVPVMQSAETPVTCVRVDQLAVCAVTATMEGWGTVLEAPPPVLPSPERP